MEIHPLSIILVQSDNENDRLLFRYPHMTNHVRDSNRCTKRKKSLFVDQYGRFITGIFLSERYTITKKKV